MEFLVRTDAVSTLPYTLLRWMQEKDKLLLEFVMAYYLEPEVTRGTCTIIRPDDDILKDLIAAIGKVVGKSPDSPDLEDPAVAKALKVGRAYILRGSITEDRIHQSNWYGSYGGRAHVVYMDVPNKTIYFHDELVSDPAKRFHGPSAKLKQLSMTGSSIFVLEKGQKMPKGVEPKMPNDKPRRPLRSPLEREAVMIGGCIACDLYGGSTTRVNRRAIMKMFIEGDDNVPRYGERWADAFMATFGPRLESCECGDAVKALLTGNSLADALVILDAAAEDESRSEAPPSRPMLVPDEVFEAWLENPSTKANPAEFYASLNESGAPEAYTKARAEFLSKVAGSSLENATQLFEKIYADLAQNRFNGAKAFDDAAFSYLSDTFGEELPGFLEWANALFYVVDQMKYDDQDPYEAVKGLLPGRFRAMEAKKFLTASFGSIEPMMNGFFHGGFAGYLRSSLDATSSVGTRREGNRMIVGGGIRHIDMDYRVFAASKKKKTSGRKTVKKLIKKLKKKTKRSVGAEKVAAKKALNAAKKKLKRKTIKKKLSKVPKRKANESDATYAARVARKKKKLETKLKKLKTKKTIKAMKADPSKAAARDHMKMELDDLKKTLAELKEERDAQLLADSKLDAVAARKKRRATKAAKKATKKKVKKHLSAIEGMDAKKKKTKTKKIAKAVHRKIRKLGALDDEELMEAIAKKKTKKVAKKKTKKIARRKAFDGDDAAFAAMNAKRKKAKKVAKKKTRKVVKKHLSADPSFEAMSAKKKKATKKKVARKVKKAAKKHKAFDDEAAFDAIAKRKVAKKLKKKTKKTSKKVAKKHVAAASFTDLDAKARKKVTRKVAKKVRRKKLSADWSAALTELDAIKKKVTRKVAKKKTKKAGGKKAAATSAASMDAAKKPKSKKPKVKKPKSKKKLALLEDPEYADARKKAKAKKRAIEEDSSLDAVAKKKAKKTVKKEKKVAKKKAKKTTKAKRLSAVLS